MQQQASDSGPEPVLTPARETLLQTHRSLLRTAPVETADRAPEPFARECFIFWPGLYGALPELRDLARVRSTQPIPYTGQQAEAVDRIDCGGFRGELLRELQSFGGVGGSG